jgi:hypothetical protein
MKFIAFFIFVITVKQQYLFFARYPSQTTSACLGYALQNNYCHSPAQKLKASKISLGTLEYS